MANSNWQQKQQAQANPWLPFCLWSEPFWLLSLGMSDFPGQSPSQQEFLLSGFLKKVFLDGSAPAYPGIGRQEFNFRKDARERIKSCLHVIREGLSKS